MHRGFAVYRASIGNIKLIYEDDTLIGLTLATESMPCGQFTPFTDYVMEQIDGYLRGKRQDFILPMHLEGTPFQKKVWQVLQEIPYGEVLTYKELAEKVGSSKAYRAVGTACGKNPIPIIIPCHRVVGTYGLGGYAYGTDIKRTLLDIERNV